MTNSIDSRGHDLVGILCGSHCTLCSGVGLVMQDDWYIMECLTHDFITQQGLHILGSSCLSGWTSLMSGFLGGYSKKMYSGQGVGPDGLWSLVLGKMPCNCL